MFHDFARRTAKAFLSLVVVIISLATLATVWPHNPIFGIPKPEFVFVIENNPEHFFVSLSGPNRPMREYWIPAGSERFEVEDDFRVSPHFLPERRCQDGEFMWMLHAGEDGRPVKPDENNEYPEGLEAVRVEVGKVCDGDEFLTTGFGHLERIN